MTNIVEFLNARLDHREQWAHAADHAVGTKYDPIVTSACETVSIPLMELYRDARPDRVLADVAAKRRVLARHNVTGAKRDYPDLNACEGCGSKGYGYGYRTPDINDCPELRDMAVLYANHPDYDPAWRVE